MCLVTVVISNYNYENYVSSAIDSCLYQDVPCRIIVVDDASTDSSWSVIKQYKDDNVQLVRLGQNSQGNARGKNVGICLSKTPYITCLDSDDMLLPESLKNRISFLNEYDFVHGRAVHLSTTLPYKDIPSEFISKYSPPQGTGFIRRKIANIESRGGGICWLQGIEASTVLCRREMYNKFGLYDEDMKWKIDREMWWRWIFHGASRKYFKEYVSIYRKHSKSITHRHDVKKPKLRSQMMKERQKIRQVLTPENTMFPCSYSFNDYIEEII